jgi:hypothetical protein
MIWYLLMRCSFFRRWRRRNRRTTTITNVALPSLERRVRASRYQ